MQKCGKQNPKIVLLSLSPVVQIICDPFSLTVGGWYDLLANFKNTINIFQLIDICTLFTGIYIASPNEHRTFTKIDHIKDLNVLVHFKKQETHSVGFQFTMVIHQKLNTIYDV